MSKVTKLKIPELKRNLKEYDQKELINLVSELYKLNDNVQQYLSVKFLGEETTNDLFKNSQKEIEDEFFPDRGFGKMRLAKARSSISNFNVSLCRGRDGIHKHIWRY
ncbi:hypothetical protein ACFQ3N_05145 [Virgibacillus byunsanensis]|uniref:Uncharacterized protein n=1 Tax=Virgibacillus byunsanensis TaxID=570945 RepID=A0ABW3LLG9_9BACI